MNNFKIDTTGDNQQVCEKIKSFIDEESKKKDFKILISELASILEIPESVISLKVKRLFRSKYSYERGSFELKTSYYKIFSNYLTSIFLLIFNLLPKPKYKKNFFNLIIDDINEFDQAKRFYKIISKLDNSLMIIHPPLKGKNQIFSKISNKNLKKIKSNFFLKCKVKIKSNLDLIKLLTKFLILSFKKKIDFCYFLKYIIISFLKYSSIFQINKANYLIQDRFFATCSVKNYLFKKNGGKLSCCTQIHLVESTISLYSDFDIFFSYGNEQDSLKKFNKLGGRVIKSVPVGSHKMEYLWHDKNKIYTSKDIDILVIGINPISWFHISKDMQENLFKFLHWIKMISIKNPKYNIVYKHHPNFPKDTKLDKEENLILKDSSIKKIIKSPKIEVDTYDYMDRSKMILSYGSSMILEGISNKKDCFFVSPHNNTSIHFSELNYINKIIIKSYDDLEKKIKLILEDKKAIDLLNDDICLNSQKVSDKIIKFINS